MKNILILGGGWYGCYLAYIIENLKEKDNNVSYTLLEKSNDLFTGSSYYNQNRLHLGFHYPYSTETIEECLEGFDLFNDKFGEIVSDNKHNYYLVHLNSSITFRDYLRTYDNYKLEYNVIEIPSELKSDNFQGCIQVYEKIIDFSLAKNFFLENLKSENIIYNADDNGIDINKNGIIYNNEKYDLLIDCTYGQSKICCISDKYELLYEKCLTIIYKNVNKKVKYNITVMDGLFYSLYPYKTVGDDRYYSLTDVEYTPLIVSRDFDTVKNYNVSDDIIKHKKELFESKILKDYPTFLEDFAYSSYYISYKCKFNNDSHNRSLIYSQNDNIISFIGGKITGIFQMERILKSMGII